MRLELELTHKNAKTFKTQAGLSLVYQTYNEESSKPLLVFNYGLVCSNVHWKEQLPYFIEQDYPILIHDYRGHYESEGIDKIDDINFENICKDLKEILVEHGVNEQKQAILLGHSMGVNICLEFCKLFPELVQKQILISGGVCPPQDVMFNTNIIDVLSPYLEIFTKKNSLWFNKVWEKQHMIPPLRKGILQGGFNPEKVGDDFVEIYLKKIGELPKELFFHMINKMKSHTIVSALTLIKTKSLIMGGDIDKVMPNYLQFSLHEKLSNSEFYLIKYGSHVPQLDFPNEINERIDYFLQH